MVAGVVLSAECLVNLSSAPLPNLSNRQSKFYRSLRTNTKPARASRNHHETHLSTFQSQARPDARFFDSNENPGRPRGNCRTPSERPQASGGLIAISGCPGSDRWMPVQRLKTRPQFQAVLAGIIVAKSKHFALHRNGLDIKAIAGQNAGSSEVRRLFREQAMWIGAMVPKRWAKPSVTRNLIKRQIYSVSADFSQQYPQAAFVVRLRLGFSRAEFISASSVQLKCAVRAELQALMHAGASAS